MKHLPCIKLIVLGYRLKYIMKLTKNLTDTIFDDNFHLDPCA